MLTANFLLFNRAYSTGMGHGNAVDGAGSACNGVAWYPDCGRCGDEFSAPLASYGSGMGTFIRVLDCCWTDPPTLLDQTHWPIFQKGERREKNTR